MSLIAHCRPLRKGGKMARNLTNTQFTISPLMVTVESQKLGTLPPATIHIISRANLFAKPEYVTEHYSFTAQPLGHTGSNLCPDSSLAKTGVCTG